MQSIICVFCRKDVSISETVINEGMTYHEHCFKLELSGNLSRYNKKAELGTLTLSEANYIKDLNYLRDLTKNFDTKPSPNYKPKIDCLDRTQLICRPKQRLASSRSVLDENFKRLELIRAERWGWETFNILENTLLLTVPEDSKLLLSGNHDKLL